MKEQLELIKLNAQLFQSGRGTGSVQRGKRILLNKL